MRYVLVNVVNAHFGGCLVQESRLDDGNCESVGGEAARWYECLCGGEQCVAEGCQNDQEKVVLGKGDWKRFYMVEMEPRWICWKAEVPMRYLE